MKIRTVFMGTPEFAVPSLEAIHRRSSHEVVGVVTVPDRPSGRGQVLTPSAVKKYAVEHQLPVLQPEKLKDPASYSNLNAGKPTSLWWWRSECCPPKYGRCRR